MGRTLICAVDDSHTSQAAGTWVAVNLARPGDALHYVSVALPLAYTMSPAAPIATGGALVHRLPESARESLDIHMHVLPAAGGASGVADSVVAFAKGRSADLVVVGSRGMGALKSTLMSLVGLGSVSSYLVHHLHCPVGICRGRKEDVEPKAKHKVMVSLDDSEASRKALEWAVENAVGTEDELHLVSVALPIPYPVVADDAVPSAVLEADEYDAALQDTIAYAREIVTNAVDAAGRQMDRKRIFFKALQPEGGASDVGQSIIHYAQENGMDLVVMGARGLGSFKRAMMSFVGLGSVSDYVTHHLSCPVIVVKH